MKTNTFAPEFVEYIPGHLDNGVLYVSIPYCTAVHKCACGCGNKVVTPISPADWQILFDGEGLSLFPSVGNWGFPCKAHYWISSNKVSWAKAWTPEQIAHGRARERRAHAEYFATATPRPKICRSRPQPHRWPFGVFRNGGAGTLDTSRNHDRRSNDAMN
jgi:hypothetical protein